MPYNFRVLQAGTLVFGDALVFAKSQPGILQAKIVMINNCRRNSLLAFIIATEKINSNIDYFKYIPGNIFFFQ